MGGKNWKSGTVENVLMVLETTPQNTTRYMINLLTIAVNHTVSHLTMLLYSLLTSQRLFQRKIDV